MNILIIKLGAKGDVVRTLSILPALKEMYPDSDIFWFTKENSAEFLEDNPYIKKILTANSKINEKFDILFNFDIDEEACILASSIKAEKKLGFYMKDGFPSAFNLGAEYYLNTLFDDELKKNNKKTYQEMMFDAAELKWKKQHCPIFLNKKDMKYASDFINKNNIKKEKLIGIHLGASPRWPSKAWHPSQVKEFIVKSRKKGYNILLFGGPDEIERYSKFAKELEDEGIKIFLNNPQNSNKEFSSLVNLCSIMVCSDSLALHVALALHKPAIGLFFCTSPDEVEDYGLLKKLVSPVLKEFFPEKSDLYDEKLVKSISAQEVLNAVEEIIKQRKVVNGIILNKSKFLIIKRKEGLHAGKWAFPGGILEKGETDKDALVREIKEETNLDIKKIGRKISTYNYKRENELVTGNSYLIFVNSFDVKINNEIDDFRWVTIEELENLELAPGIEEEALKSLYK